MSRKNPHVQDSCRPGVSLTKAKITPPPLPKQTGFKGSISHSRKTKKAGDLLVRFFNITSGGVAGVRPAHP